jgi:tRNA(Arg) A34 adenosine deaminase TadA
VNTLPQIGEFWWMAFNAAINGYLHSSFPIGACIVTDANEVIAVESNASGTHPLDHAEYRAIRKIESQEMLSRSTIYSIMEPCPMCTGAIRLAKIRNLHFAAYDPAAGFSSHLRNGEFMSNFDCTVVGPKQPDLEKVVVALNTECRLRLGKTRWNRNWISRYPDSFEAGRRLNSYGQFDKWKNSNATPEDIYADVLSAFDA